jgi:hypothetical protein
MQIVTVYKQSALPRASDTSLGSIYVSSLHGNNERVGECSHENLAFVPALTLYLSIALQLYTYVKMIAPYAMRVFGMWSERTRYNRVGNFANMCVWYNGTWDF